MYLLSKSVLRQISSSSCFNDGHLRHVSNLYFYVLLLMGNKSLFSIMPFFAYILNINRICIKNYASHREVLMWSSAQLLTVCDLGNASEYFTHAVSMSLLLLSTRRLPYSTIYKSFLRSLCWYCVCFNIFEGTFTQQPSWYKITSKLYSILLLLDKKHSAIQDIEEK